MKAKRVDEDIQTNDKSVVDYMNQIGTHLTSSLMKKVFVKYPM